MGTSWTVVILGILGICLGIALFVVFIVILVSCTIWVCKRFHAWFERKTGVNVKDFFD